MIRDAIYEWKGRTGTSRRRKKGGGIDGTGEYAGKEKGGEGKESKIKTRVTMKMNFRSTGRAMVGSGMITMMTMIQTVDQN